MQLVWFKRDLRIHDHAPLRAAAAAGPVLALYVHEPSLLAQPEMDARHAGFLREALDAWLQEEPFLKEGVYGHIDVKPFNKAFPKG